MTIDPNAPVTAIGTIEITAPPRDVWTLLTDIENWPTWNPDVKWADLDGDLAVGSTFRWKAGPGVIQSEILEISEGTVIAWKGSTLGIHAVHVWTVSPSDAGCTVTTSESWNGVLPRLLASRMTRTLQTAIDNGLQAIKKAAETSSSNGRRP